MLQDSDVEMDVIQTYLALAFAPADVKQEPEEEETAEHPANDNDVSQLEDSKARRPLTRRESLLVKHSLVCSY